MKKTRSLGFTLVEMLIVVAIIGIMTTVVIGSTTLTRSRARDSRRMGDMKEIQLGLALYYDVNKSYPAALDTLVSQRYLPSIPTDPTASASYEYLVTNGRYCLGVTLEGSVPDDTVSCTSASSGSTANYKAQPTN